MQQAFDKSEKSAGAPAQSTERTVFAVPSAGFWYTAARKAQAEGKMREAVMYMENAFNHTENALFAARRSQEAAPRAE